MNEPMVGHGIPVTLLCVAAAFLHSGCSFDLGLTRNGEDEATTRSCADQYHAGAATRGIELAELLKLASRLGSLPVSELRERLRDTTQRIEASGRAADKLQLALLLSRPGAPLEEVNKARAILVEVANDRGLVQHDAVWRDFATFQLGVLEAQLWRRGELGRLRRSGKVALGENEELEHQVSVLQEQLISALQRLGTCTQQCDTVERHRDTLERQLEELKAIEKKIEQRAPSGSVPPGSVKIPEPSK